MYKISNRRYTGSKYKLLDEIESCIEKYCTGDSFFDVFAGTGVVSDRMRKFFPHIIINDFLFSNEVIYRAFFENEPFDNEKILAYKTRYQSFAKETLSENYFSENFGDKYFSRHDAKVIGFIRDDLSHNADNFTPKEFNILLASLIFSMDKIANTVGHYDAYRKIKKIEDRFEYDLIDAQPSAGTFDIYREDANQLAKKVKADVAFVDPPYNSRQYSRFYHILENITKWDCPPLTGTALKPPPENMSEYCRSSAPIVFEELIYALNVKFIIVTYNNTYHSKSNSSKNKISLEQIDHILNNRGSTIRIEKDHPFFNAGKTDFENHKEYIFVTEVKN